jgi:TP901 family phage tail tape measure protein
MAANQVVKTTFRGADKLSPVLKRIGIRVDTTGRKIDKSFKRATKSASVFGGALKGILVAGAIQRGAMAASLAIRGLSDEFVEFDKNITKAITRLPGGLDRSSDAFKKFGDVARKEAARTEFTAGEAAKGVEQLALAGFDLEKVMGTLPGVLNLATNADVELATAATMATKTLGAFGLKSKDTATTVQNLTRVNDVFSRTVSSASIDMEQLFEVMKFGGPAAKAAGQSIETFAALSGVLADSAIDASVAGTSLRSMFINLAAPVPKAAKLLKKLRIGVKRGNGDFRDFFDIMKDVEKATKKMGNAQRLATLNTLFGKRAVNAANVMLEKGSVELDKYRKKLQNASGSAAKMAKTIRTSIEGRLKRLKSALVEVGFKFIEAFNKGAGDSIESAIKAISEFDVKPVVAELKKIIAFVKDATKFVDDHRFAIKLVIGAWIGYKVKLKAIMALEAVAFFKDVAIALHGGAEGATAMAKGLSMVKTVGKGLLAAITSVTTIFAALGAVVFVVATDFENVILGITEGFLKLDLNITFVIGNAIKLFKKLLQVMMPVLDAVGLGDFAKSTAMAFIDNQLDSATEQIYRCKVWPS